MSNISQKLCNVKSAPDALNLATAITENADVFITMDDKLVGNKKIESVFGIKIKHPRDV